MSIRIVLAAALAALAAPALAQTADGTWAACQTRGDESCDRIAADARATSLEKATAHFNRAIGHENAAINAANAENMAARDARRADALNAYARAIRADRTQTAAIYNEARLRHGANQKVQAMAGYTAVIDADPLLAPDALALRARLQIARGDLMAALADANEAVRRRPNTPQGYLVRSEVLRRQGQETRADAEEARGYALLSPDDKASFTEVGEYSGFARVGFLPRPTREWRLANQFARGGAAYAFPGSRPADALRAIREFDIAVAIAPNDAAPYQQRGEAYFAARKYAEALTDFERCEANARARTPTFVHACLHGRGKVREATGDAAAALVDYDAAVAANGDNAAYRNAACWARATLGQDLDRALTDCNEALRLKPRNPGYLDSRGLVHLRAGRFVQAEADYTAAMTAAGAFPHAQFGRGLARLKQDRRLEGQADIAAATAADADLPERFAGFGLQP
jgi:tetratricopeptide (TPR) repeat protein